MVNLDNTVAQMAMQAKIAITADSKDKVRLKEQTDEFEALIIKQMLDISMPEENEGLFPKTAGDKIYRSMFHEELSRNLAGGFGYSELLYNFLSKNVK